MPKDCRANFPVAGLIKTAGIDWLQGFKKRHKNLMLRKPENTSLFRSTAFSKTNIMEFFDDYEPALKSWKFTADRVYTIEEKEVDCLQLYSLLILLLRLGQNRLDKLPRVNEELRLPYV